MIDPLKEELILPRDAAGLFPKGPKGRKIHVCCIYRYMTVGVRGVVLESLDAPRRCTSREAVARFLERLTERAETRPTADRTRALRGRSTREVEQELDRLGI
jgi:hypothetical protein